MNRVIRWSTSLGLAALLMGSWISIGISAAHADDWHEDRRADIRRDKENIRHDEDRLADLQARHDEARRHHDWDEMHRTDREIDHVQDRIAQERRDLRHDEEREHHDH